MVGEDQILKIALCENEKAICGSLATNTDQNKNQLSICLIPDDHISPRRSALFMARSVLRDLRDGGRSC
jgi:hypothetical protein